MIFGANQYVPILKLKRGEKVALGRISPNRRARMTPLLQVVERVPDKSVDAHIDTAFK
ncbi:MAG: beta family protein, partial [Actinobacteria bacterium]|nr:beta family protein [Actinomycetota bacterium]MCA1708367.1 beta family protein [Actinomycetota bacterium]